jgi:hypothetical protein
MLAWGGRIVASGSSRRVAGTVGNYITNDISADTTASRLAESQRREGPVWAPIFIVWFVWHMRRSLSPGAALTPYRMAMEVGRFRVGERRLAMDRE